MRSLLAVRPLSTPDEFGGLICCSAWQRLFYSLFCEGSPLLLPHITVRNDSAMVFSPLHRGQLHPARRVMRGGCFALLHFSSPSQQAAVAAVAPFKIPGHALALQSRLQSGTRERGTSSGPLFLP